MHGVFLLAKCAKTLQFAASHSECSTKSGCRQTKRTSQSYSEATDHQAINCKGKGHYAVVVVLRELASD